MNPQHSANGSGLGSRDRWQRVPQPAPGGEINILAILSLEEEIRGYERIISKFKRARRSLLDGPTLSQERADETNIDSELRVLDEKIREHRRPILERKRIQNSLLNVSLLPPEILGYIFWLTFNPEGFEKRSFNFLFVCNYWYEVASHNPGLWASWGTSLQNWKNRHLRYPEIPLDLVLEQGKPRSVPLDFSVQNALQDRASRGAIRLVCLRSANGDLLGSILSTLAAGQKEVRRSNMESFILQNKSDMPVDASRFFAHTNFPRLRHLDLTHCTVSSWDAFTSQTNLTKLVLHLASPSSIPTTPRLLSFIASNPSLQKLALTRHSVPRDRNQDHPSVSLPKLKELEVAGEWKDVSMFLNRLVYPDILDHLHIGLDSCTTDDISHTVGPFLQDHFRRRGRPQSDLGIYTSFARDITFHVCDIGSNHSPTLISERIAPFLSIDIAAVPNLPRNSPEELLPDIIAYIPREEVVRLQIYNLPTAATTRGNSGMVMGNIYTLLPNLRALHSKWIPLSAVFPGPDSDGKDLVFSQSLRYLFLEHALPGGDWTPFTNFLLSPFHSSVKRLDFLQIKGPSCLPPEVEHVIRSSAQEFRFIPPKGMSL